MRIGIGYDVHPFAAGRPLLLGGVRFETDYGLSGHSDGDCLTHAVIDAVLGAAGLGDIGVHFPPSDERYRDADSIGLLSEVMSKLHAARFVVLNVDATVVAAQPRIADQAEAMRHRLASALGTEISQVSIKATTTDGLGALGRGEGLAAMAVALIDERPGS
jgi:2-C-methyl-D-erythritol 2,4-cyclodiphosphate synthase